MLTTAFAALVFVLAVQAYLVVTAADRLPAEAVTGRETREAVLPTAGRTTSGACDAGLYPAGRYARAA